MVLAAPAAADEFKTPAISAVHVEWRAALDQFKSEIAAHPELGGRFTFTSRRRLSPSDPRIMPAFEQLNAITSPLFSGISVTARVDTGYRRSWRHPLRAAPVKEAAR